MDTAETSNNIYMSARSFPFVEKALARVSAERRQATSAMLEMRLPEDMGSSLSWTGHNSRVFHACEFPAGKEGFAIVRQWLSLLDAQAIGNVDRILVTIHPDILVEDNGRVSVSLLQDLGNVVGGFIHKNIQIGLENIPGRIKTSLTRGQEDETYFPDECQYPAKMAHLLTENEINPNVVITADICHIAETYLLYGGKRSKTAVTDLILDQVRQVLQLGRLGGVHVSGINLLYPAKVPRRLAVKLLNRTSTHYCGLGVGVANLVDLDKVNTFLEQTDVPRIIEVSPIYLLPFVANALCRGLRK